MVTVVIISFRTPELTAAAARSALLSGSKQVVVVDNASADSTLISLSSEADLRLTVIENRTNAGFGTAANQGGRLADGDAVLFLNSDARLDGAAVVALITELERWDGRAIVGPRLYGIDGIIQRSAGLRPARFDLALRALGLHAIGGWLASIPVVGSWVRRTRSALDYASAETADNTIDTSMVSGACFAIGREAFVELGGFDERFFMYFEDADLCRRAAAAGMPIRYVPSAVVTHIGGASSSEDYHFGPLHARSMRQYLGKWYGPVGSALAIALLWLRAVGFSVTLRPAAKRAWQALWAAIRDEDPRL